MLRHQSLRFPCLPFGWNLSPVLAQHDRLIVASLFDLCSALTQHIAQFLTSLQKFCAHTHTTHLLVWQNCRRVTCNTPATPTPALALAPLCSSIPTFPKTFHRLTGCFLWYTRAFKRATLLLRSWHLTRWTSSQLNHAHPKMRRAHFHLFLMGLNPWQAPTCIRPALFNHVLKCRCLS